MELATADAVQPREGEAAFILQLRPPETANADALASGLDRYTSLFLERAVSDRVRFSPLGGLTWALCAPVEHVDDVDAACDELAGALFGDPASEAVHLARQPDLPRQEDYRIQNQALSDEEGEAVMQDLAEHEWDLEDDSSAAESGPDAEEDGAAPDGGTVDLDAFDPSAEDDWNLATPIDEEPFVVLDDAPGAESETELETRSDDPDAVSDSVEEFEDPEAGPSVDLASEPEFEAEPELEPEPEPEPVAEFDAEPQLETGLEPELDSEDDFELAQPSEPEPEPEPEPEADSADEYAADGFSDPDDAGLSDLDAVGDEDLEQIEDEAFVLAQDDDEQAFDLDAATPESGLEDVLEEALEEINATSRIWDENADTVDIDDIAASALHETRLGSQADIAAELSAFREEMKAIAQSIPSGGMDAALADFRAGLETLSGEIGQRVDGAAQRIEAAVGQLDVNRYDAASQRVESAAALMETSVQEALQALKSASTAMATPSASEIFEEKDRDSV